VTFRVISPASVDFPDSLHALGNTRPAQLFVLGDVSHLAPPTVAIVGTRDATAYGTRVTRTLASAFASAGVSVISGMARGIDAAAHRAALEAGGRTVAVLGTGIDVPYPAGHRELHRTIAERGCVVSEYGAGVGARPGTFPRRNRIIAALAPLTIVVEAGHKSGALLTAGYAESLNRIVAAVPGPIDSPQSAGSNHLLRDRVQMIASVADALALVGITSPHESAPLHLSDIDARVWKALASGPLSPDGIAEAAKVTTRECLASITSLELDGRVEVLLTGEVRRR
jgi:DNA processing protein